MATLPQLPKLQLVESHGLEQRCASISGLGKIDPTRRPSPILRTLVVEQAERIILVDPGIGLFDWLAPSRRLGIGAGLRLRQVRAARPPLRPLLEQRGLSPDRVTDIVLTHAHLDVLGAMSDFPQARVHALPSVAQRLLDGSLPQAAHHQSFVRPLEAASLWHGFKSHRLQLAGVELALLELPGHTEDHAGVLVSSGNGFVLYLGGAINALDELMAQVPPAGFCQWMRLLRDARPFASLVTRDRLRSVVRRPPCALTFVLARDATPRFSVGPGPYPSIGFL